MKTLDACGISCPEPVIMLKKALKTETELFLLVDNKFALENCEKYAKKQGFSVDITIDGEIYKLHIRAIK